MLQSVQQFVPSYFRTWTSFLARNEPHYKVRVVFSKSIHVARARIIPLGNNQVHFTSKPSSCHVHSLWMTPPTSYNPTLSADAEPKHTDTFLCSAQNDIIKSALESLMTRLRIYHVKNDSKIWVICTLYWSWLIKDDSVGSPLQLRSTKCGRVKCKRSWWLVTQIAKKPGSLVFIPWSASIIHESQKALP